MANMAAKIFAAALDEHDLRYSYVDDEERVINIGWKIEGGKLDLNFAFSEDNEDVQIFGFFLKVPEDKCAYADARIIETYRAVLERILRHRAWEQHN